MTLHKTSPLVFITGASSGLGQALALHYAKQGWRLALVARRHQMLQDWLKENNLPPDIHRAYEADVAQPESIIQAALTCIEQQGLPQVVIANAGISHGVNTAERGDLGVMQKIWATNNLGMAATFHSFIKPMRERGGGSLVGIASVAGIRGLPGHGAYCSSKAGVIAFCESLRGDLRGSGVKVTTISPGFVDTPMTRGNPFPMPFLMPADQFAAKAFEVIEAGKSYRVIPWQMGWLAKLLQILPDAVFDKALAGRQTKPRSEH